jgi:aminoglycoside 2'-N-acetyltransferase I
MVRETCAMTSELTFQILLERDRSAGQETAIIDLCARAYQEDFSDLFHTFTGATHILATLDGMLVSHALWVTRWLQPEGLPLLRSAYIEAVATEEAFRGRGYATQVMQRVAKEIAAFDLGGLSPAETRVYSRLGWEFWRGPLSIRTERGLLPTPTDRAMVLRLPGTPLFLNLDAPLSAEWREGELW